MAIHWQIISPGAKPYEVKGIKYTYTLENIVPVTKPYRLKVKGIKYGYTLEKIIPVTKPCNEVQALVFFVYLNHSKIL